MSTFRSTSSFVTRAASSFSRLCFLFTVATAKLCSAVSLSGSPANPATDLLKSVMASSVLAENSCIALVISDNFLLVSASIILAIFSKFSSALDIALPAASSASSPDRIIKSSYFERRSIPGVIYLSRVCSICPSVESLIAWLKSLPLIFSASKESCSSAVL